MGEEIQHLRGFMDNETATLTSSKGSLKLKEETYESTAYKIMAVDSI